MAERLHSAVQPCCRIAQSFLHTTVQICLGAKRSRQHLLVRPSDVNMVPSIPQTSKG